MPILDNSLAHEVRPPLTSGPTDTLTPLPTRATLLDRIAEHTASADHKPTALLLIGLLRRDNGWPMPGNHLDPAAPHSRPTCAARTGWPAPGPPNSPSCSTPPPTTPKPPPTDCCRSSPKPACPG